MEYDQPGLPINFIVIVPNDDMRKTTDEDVYNNKLTTKYYDILTNLAKKNTTTQLSLYEIWTSNTNKGIKYSILF